jgi:CelD/BcsL family acetyltransferase involved in cellulose biosynthesis
MPVVAEIAVERHVGALSDLESTWRGLEDPDHPGAAFRSFAWIASWWETFGARLEPLVLVARTPERTVGILPLYLVPLPLGGKQVRLMGDRHVGSDYLGVVAASRDAPDVARGFARHLRAWEPAEIVLGEILDDDPLAAALAPGGIVTFRYPCPAIRLRGAFDEYLSTLPQGTGKQWLRRRRWLERRPGYRFEIRRQPAEIASGMEILFDLHRRRWALEGGSDGITGPEVETFHRIAAGRLADRGAAIVFVLHAEGEPRAALYGFDTGERLSFYQAGHDPAWRQRSVGTVVLGLAIETAFSEHKSEFDFLHGNEDYKLAWANDSRRTVSLAVRGPGFRPWLRSQGRTIDVAARTLAKRFLPAEVVSWARHLRTTASRST